MVSKSQPKSAPRRAGSAIPSHSNPVWDRINQGEIGARIEVLATQLRRDRAQSLRCKFSDLRQNIPTQLKPFAAVATEHSVQRATLDTDLEFLREYLHGACDIFADYLDRMQLRLEPGEIAEIWTGGIGPRWKGQVQLVTARWRRQVGLNESVREAYISDVKAGAARTHDEEWNNWRVRIEQATAPKGQSETKKTLPVPIRNGERCVRVSEEMRRIKHMCLEGGRTMADIRHAHPAFQVWAIRDNLGSDDQDVFDHPGRWGAGYNKLILSMEYTREQATIKDWMKAYRRHSRARDGAKR